LARKVTLDHLFNANAGIGGAGYMGGSSVGGTGYMGGSSTGGLGYMGGSGIGGPSFEYGMPGRGGRTPVTWLGPEPARRADADLPCRRPVVAVLDTGTGKHPWLPASVVDRNPKVGALPIGMTDSLTNPELHGSIDDPLEGILDSDAGHGTFIAGLIRQTCPDATLLSVRVMHGDGAVPESQFLRSLNRLVLRQAIASQNGRPDLQIDVVSLSLGYYHELPSDEALDHQLLAPLAELGRLGVTVVAAAGNDATSRHMYPAGFAPHPGSPMPVTRDRAPIVSVGALNPDRRTSALFSNAGDWVTCLRHGAAVVSTMPTALNGSLQASASIELPGGGRRSTIDPDDYFGGFATWSGTSFASPVLAGEIAQSLLSTGKLDEATPAKAVARAWRAVSKLTGLSRPAGSAT
jgi:subtilisin family serine protease